MVQVAARSPISIDDYLEEEKMSEIRHEYIDGLVSAMTGASKNHNRIAQRLARLIGDEIDGTGCEAFVSDVKVRISRGSENRFYYPDLLVECVPLSDDPYYADRPVLIVEVLSRSTERNGRAEKFRDYRKLPSLLEYVLIAQDEPRIEVYRLDRQWDFDLYGAGDTVRLDSIGCAFPVDRIYTGIAFRGD